MLQLSLKIVTKLDQVNLVKNLKNTRPINTIIAINYKVWITRNGSKIGCVGIVGHDSLGKCSTLSLRKHQTVHCLNWGILLSLRVQVFVEQQSSKYSCTE